MARTTCAVCRHDRAGDIGAALLGGMSVRAAAAQFELSKSTVWRHLAECLAEQVAAARNDGKRIAGLELIERLKALTTETTELLEEARVALDRTGAIKAIARLEAQIRMEAELGGELEVPGTSTMSTVTLELHPDWVQLRQVILSALAPHAEARRAVVLAIDERKAA